MTDHRFAGFEYDEYAPTQYRVIGLCSCHNPDGNGVGRADFAAPTEAEAVNLWAAHADVSLRSRVEPMGRHVRGAVRRPDYRKDEAMSANDPRLLAKHVRKISRYEGITEGQASVLRAAADALEAAQDWKAQAMTVLSEWEATYEAAGSPGRLGQSKAVALREEVERLRALSAHPASPLVAVKDEVARLLFKSHHGSSEQFDWWGEESEEVKRARHEADALLASGKITNRTESDAQAIEQAVEEESVSNRYGDRERLLARAARLRSGKAEA